MTTSMPAVGNNLDSGGMFQQLLAVQSMHTLQNMLTGKAGGSDNNSNSLYHNAKSFAIIICIDMFKRLMDVSVTSLIDNRLPIVKFLCGLLKDGWRRVLTFLITELIRRPLILCRNLLLRRGKLEEKEDANSTQQQALLLSPASASPNSVVQGLSTLHEWQMIMQCVPPEDVSFHRYPRFTWKRHDATSTRFVETLSNILLTCDPTTTARIPGAFELEWDVLQHRSLFDSSKVRHERRLVSVKTSADTDPRLVGVFDTSRMVHLTSLLPFVPFARFVAYINARKQNPDTFALLENSAVFKKGGRLIMQSNFTSSGTKSLLNSLVDAGVTYDGWMGRLLCGADLTYLLIAMTTFVEDKIIKYDNKKRYCCMDPESRFLGHNLSSDTTLCYMMEVSIASTRQDIIGVDPPEIHEVGEWMLQQLYPGLHADHIADQNVQTRNAVATTKTKVTDKNHQDATYTVELLSLTTLPESSLELVRAWDAFLTRTESRHDEYQGGSDKTNAEGDVTDRQQQFVPKTFTLHVREHETETSEPNPEFEAYEEKMRLLDTSANNSSAAAASTNGEGNRHSNNGDTTSMAAIKFALFEARPEKFIRRITKRKVVHQELINETRRDLSALYLREKDERNLNTCLVNFRDNKAALAELGIPNKLGVLLHGLPGTGKSSTIAAIATFLRKDVFYLHLNEIRSNAELKIAFDHVFKLHPGGGVVVMEDVDAMSEVVRKRDYQSPSPSAAPDHTPFSSCSSSDGTDDLLTLEFFLNVLQGSLTVDGSVFVATTNHLVALDPAFCRKGRFDVSLEMRASDRYQITRIFRRFFHRIPSPDLSDRIIEDVFTPAEVIAHFAQYLLRAEHTEDAHILEPFIREDNSV